MDDSPFYRYVFPVVWAVGCLVVLIGGSAAAWHFLGGLCPFLLGSSHRREIQADWTNSFIRASVFTFLYIPILLWLSRRKKRRQEAASN